MYDLLRYAFCSGSSHRNPLNLEASAKAFVHNYRQDFMTTKMIKIADEIDNQALSVYNNENLVYCTVAIDEGATKSRKLLYFCLEDPIICTVAKDEGATKSKSYPAFSYLMDEITAPNYVTAITTGLSYLESKNIHFGTVIVDNATAQAKAFKYAYKNSLRYKAKSKLIRNVLVIFCA